MVLHKSYLILFHFIDRNQHLGYVNISRSNIFVLIIFTPINIDVCIILFFSDNDFGCSLLQFCLLYFLRIISVCACARFY